MNGNILVNTCIWCPSRQDVPLLRNGGEFYVSDANKNIVALLDTTGMVTDYYLYEPFGNCTHTGNSGNPFRFSSEFFDNEIDLAYYNYRYYNPKLGCWIKRDPIEEKGGMNLYTYLDNDILFSADILGMISPSHLLTEIGVCMLKCSLQSVAQDAFLNHLSRANLTGNAKRICETELRLPKPNEILGAYYTYNFRTNEINCLKDCLAEQIPYLGDMISKNFNFKVTHHILSSSNFSCQNDKPEVTYELYIKTDYSIQIGDKKYHLPPKYNRMNDKLGSIAWCRCCNGL